MNFTKHNPCPICGKPDYCGWVKSQNGILIGCHRDQNIKINEKINGCDGNTYILVRIKNGVYVYEEENQLKNARLEYSLRVNEIKNKKPNLEHFKKKEDIIKKENIYDVADVKRLNDVYTEFLKFNPLKDKHKNKLKDEGWTEKMIENCGFYSSEDHKKEREKIVKHLAANFKLNNVPGFYVENGKWTYKLQPGMLIPVRDINKNIIRIMIRPDWNYYQLKKIKKEGKKVNKYLSFSSFEDTKENPMVNTKLEGAKATSQVGVYYEDDDKWDKIIITEGYKKAKAINSLIKMPVLALPGANSYSKIFEDDDKSLCEILKEKGTKTVLIAYDADIMTNIYVKKAFDKLVEKCKENGFSTKCFMWNILDGKGLDDLLLNGKKPIIVSL